MKNCSNPELAASIFCPLSIYEDAEQTALYSLKSCYLQEKIKDESEMC
jgi:hypothetical protein